MIAGTTTADAAARRIWDAVVVGAGPAGSVAALGIARQGLRVLLVDRARFPRHKLCGACLNGDALAGIRELGLTSPLRQLGGIPLQAFQLRSRGRATTLPLPAGTAVSRTALDAMLVKAAMAAGVDFLPGTQWHVGGEANDVRQLSAVNAADVALKARVVVIATGLATDREVSDPALSVVTEVSSRIGVGTIADRFPAEYAPGTIYMAVGRRGYVGLTRTEGGRLNIAAALDRDPVRAASPHRVCARILDEAGFPQSDEMFTGAWRGTMGLTRHRRMRAATRLFVVGDAAGYVEPFTGEGMAWAIRSAQAVAPFVSRAVGHWTDSLIQEWSEVSRNLVGRRQRWCRALAWTLRSPLAVQGLLGVMRAMPSLGRAVVRHIHQERG